MDKMLEQLTAILAAIQNTASTELPLIAQQILEWELMKSVGWAILFAVIMVVLLIFVVCYAKNTKYISDSDFSAIMFAVVLIIMTGIFFAYKAQNVLKIKYAPKVYLLDEIQDRLKSVRN
jgi:predicted Na+-dependent transporter